MFYHQQIFRTTNHHWFHDQIGYLTWDTTNNLVYDTFCIPRAVCVVAEGRPGNPMTLTTKSQGIAQTQYMVHNDVTETVKATFQVTGNILKYKRSDGTFRLRQAVQTHRRGHADESEQLAFKSEA